MPRAWRVGRESQVEGHLAALRSAETPMVGREEELDLLLRRWALAAAGQGRMVLLSGEPGIGKSRLTAALQQRIEDEPHTRLRYFCSPHYGWFIEGFDTADLRGAKRLLDDLE